MRWIRVVSLAALVSSAGCVAEYNYTLNPDGSGRLVYSLTMPDASYRDYRGVEHQITRLGIDAWEDVSITRDVAGTATFRATGYFQDASNVLRDSRFELFLKDNADGTKTLELRHGRQHDYRPRRALTEDQIQARIAKMTSDYLKQLQDPANAKNRKGRYTIVIDPPGKVRTAVNMALREDGKLEVVLDAAAIQDDLGRVLADKKKIREIATAGETVNKCGDTLTSMLNEEVFGIRSQMLAVLEGPFEAKFDYAAAVEAAESDVGAVIRGAGFIPASGPEPIAAANTSAATKTLVGSTRGDRLISVLLLVL